MFAVLTGAVAGASCAGPPNVPDQPTWVDVQPILAGACSQCHGSTASETGFGYRLDFYDMTEDVCGEAAKALPSRGLILAGDAAHDIFTDVTPTDEPARMPPAPGPALYDWQRQTIQKWTVQPVKGPSPADNRWPALEVIGLPAGVARRLQFTALLSDPDGDPVVGVIKAPGVLFAMNRTGSLDVDIDTRTWPTGTQYLTAVLCDGWTNVSYNLGPIDVDR